MFYSRLSGALLRLLHVKPLLLSAISNNGSTERHTKAGRMLKPYGAL